METALTHAILGIAAASEKVGAGAEEFSSLAEETNAGVEESRAGIEDVSSRMESLAASARDIGNGVGEMAAGAQSFARKNAEMASEVENARSAGEDGMRAVERAVSSIVKVAEDAGRSALEIGGLGDRAREIQSFVAQIGGIADQTNLLALNAAIEAARAGEAGRGFAVVAEEVRKLAEESNKAAGRIADLAGGITKDLEKVVASSRSNAKDSEGASELAQETRRTIEKMMGGLSRISAATQELAAVSQQQAASSEAIAGAVQDVVSRVASSAESADNVRGQMREVGEAGERVAQGAEELSVLSSELRALVAAFKYDQNRLEVLSGGK
jgi:methyl-accepting chemotaxis protein